MKRYRQTILGLLFFFCLNISYAMYDPQVGRFMQRDPLGINPAGGLKNPFNARKQYSDGMNIYEYVKSNPIMNKDPLGLMATPATSSSDKACCKIVTTHQNYNPPGSYNTYKTCSQVTIDSKGASPSYACKCRYKNRNNVKIYGAYEGECCWCDVYIGWVTNPGDADTDVRFHTKLYVKCAERSAVSFTAETTPNDAGDDAEVSDLIIGGTPVYPRVDRGNGMHLAGYSWSHKGRISCDVAEQASGVIENTQTYWSIRHNCWYWAHSVNNTLLGLCP